jgi:hypothetical protein
MDAGELIAMTLLAVGVAACGSESRLSDDPARQQRTGGLALTVLPTRLEQPTTWTGDLEPVEGGGYALDGTFSLRIDEERPLILRKLYGAAACAGHVVTIEPASFTMRAKSVAGDEVSGELARGADAHPLGTLEVGEYTLAFKVAASAPCSIALAFVSEPADG